MVGYAIRTYRGFVTYPEGPDVYFALITTPEKTVSQAGQVGAVFLGDAMTVRDGATSRVQRYTCADTHHQIYRVYKLWNHNLWIILLPSLTLMVTGGQPWGSYHILSDPDAPAVFGVGFVTLQHHVSVQTSIYSSAVTLWTEVWLWSSLFTTVYCTGEPARGDRVAWT